MSFAQKWSKNTRGMKYIDIDGIKKSLKFFKTLFLYYSVPFPTGIEQTPVRKG